MMNNLEKLRADQPLVICYTNDVVKNFTANGLLSLGASPAMSEAPEEAHDMLTAANALLINIGTLTKEREQDILKIAKTANHLGKPIIFDPVAVGASQYRKDFCKKFLNEIKVTVIKGNASEILTLINSATKMKGTDGDSSLDSVSIAKEARKHFNTSIVITGKEDVIAQNERIFKLSNGSPLLARITGAGCLLGAIVASFVDSETPSINALIEAVSLYNIAAEKAEQISAGPGSFKVELLNALYNMTFETDIQYQNKQEV